MDFLVVFYREELIFEMFVLELRVFDDEIFEFEVFIGIVDSLENLNIEFEGVIFEKLGK